jgi:hypothetical protein
MEVTLSIPSVRDIEQLGDIAGELLDELETVAGDSAPVVTGHFSADRPGLTVSVDITARDPTQAVSEALGLIELAAARAEVSIGPVQAISLNAAHDAEFSSARATA